MENRTCALPRPDWVELLKTLQFHTVIDCADQRQQDILVDWAERDEKALRATLRYESAVLDEVSDFLHTDDEARYAVLRLGSLLGTVECFNRVLFEQTQDQWAQARLQEQAMHARHLPKIVLALETHGSMTHTELSQCLKINPPTLTEAMKKVLETGAVEASSMGKYKVYALTDSGLRYGRELRKKNRSGNPVDDALQTLQQYIKIVNDALELEELRTRLRTMLNERPAAKACPDNDLNAVRCPVPFENTVQPNFNIRLVVSAGKPIHNAQAGSFPEAVYPRNEINNYAVFAWADQVPKPLKTAAQKRRISKWQCVSAR